MSRRLAPKGGCDVVMTPRKLALDIILHFNLRGYVLDPCRGEGAFYDQFTACNGVKAINWCEISDGRDFMTFNVARLDERSVDYCVSNPPWSEIRGFNRRAMEISDNIIWLCLVNAFWMKARLRDMDQAKFGIKEILFVDTPPKPWPQTGFQLGATHIQRGYKGPIKISK